MKRADCPHCQEEGCVSPEDFAAVQAALAQAERERDHISEEGTACANCHDPVHAFELPRLRAEVERLKELYDQARAALEGR